MLITQASRPPEGQISTPEGLIQPNLAVVAIHGKPEVTGLELKADVEENPEEGWDVEVADRMAVELGVRSCEKMWNSFPGAADAGSYGSRRAAEVLATAELRHRVLEIHDRPDATGEYVATCGTWNPRLLGVAALLGIRNVVHQVGLTRLGFFQPNTLVVEMCRADADGSQARIADNVRRLRRCMRAITLGDVPPVNLNDFKYYVYYPNFEFDRAEVEARGLLETEGTIAPFDPMPAYIIKKLDLPPGGDYVADNWGICSNLTGFGTILRRTGPPQIYGPEVTIRDWGETFMAAESQR